jgi:hypothetical protein
MWEDKNVMTIIFYPSDFPNLKRTPTPAEALAQIRAQDELKSDDVIMYRSGTKDVLLKKPKCE